MTRRTGGRLLALVVVVAASGAPAATIDYLHVTANDGNSAGGHAALRIGRDVYHYQHRPPGLLVAARSDDADFNWHYGVLQNRSMRVAHLQVSDDVRERLRAGFNRRYLRQRRDLEQGAALRRDAALLADWAAGRPPGRRLCVRGAGLFDGSARDEPSPAGEAPVLRELARRVARRYGAAYLPARIHDLEAALRSLGARRSLGPPATAPSDGDGPTLGPRFADRHHELAAGLVALRTLAAARPVRPAMLRPLGTPEPPLAAAEMAWLARLRERLLHSLARLPASSRPDWGYPLLLGMARLQAIDASLASGRLIVLDAFADDPAVHDRDPPALTRELDDAAGRELRTARAGLRAASPDEPAYTRLEAAANRRLELRRALARATVRLAPDPLLPQACAQVADLPEPRVAPGALPALRDAAAARAARWEATLHDRYGYGLAGANCVTEIFATIDAVLGPDAAARLTGARLAPPRGLAFIPFVSFDALIREAGSVQVERVPSYRLRRLRTMLAREPALLVHLREASTLTSTVYRRNADDPFFLFFTDDTVLPRPLYGLANLAAGLVESAVGVVRAPFDGGRTVRRGLRGAGFSLPELAFLNVRKGRMAYGPEPAPVTRPARTVASRPPARSPRPRSAAGSRVAAAPSSR